MLINRHARLPSSGRSATPRFPIIDFHNHAWAGFQPARAVNIMDRAGIALYGNLTGNIQMVWAGGGYQWQETPFNAIMARVKPQTARRFFSFTAANFARPASKPLFEDAARFIDETLAILHDHTRQGARGLKVLKELGLHYRDGKGRLIFCDDRRLAPIWDECARLKLPVLIHQADPLGFFQPIRPKNPHYSSLQKYPSWSYADRQRFPSFAVLQRHCRNLVQQHPRTQFILPHIANWPENLEYVEELLDSCPNLLVDLSARIDDLGHQPDAARAFFIRHQNRLIFGTDMPPSVKMYRAYFQFLETDDDNIIPPDYDGTFGRYRWRIRGLKLPDKVLRKIYHDNAAKLLGLKK
ncbi:MAG: amidohydrolase family protein [Kiritimatiellia bacterium]|jgi:predicted TIM-barrel fold metal-dependent hydrolase